MVALPVLVAFLAFSIYAVNRPTEKQVRGMLARFYRVDMSIGLSDGSATFLANRPLLDEIVAERKKSGSVVQYRIEKVTAGPFEDTWEAYVHVKTTSGNHLELFGGTDLRPDFWRALPPGQEPPMASTLGL